MHRKLLYIFNPISGTKRKDALIKKIEFATKQKGLYYELLSSNASGDYDWLKEKIRKDRLTDIIIVGGDGTVNQITNALRDYDIQFGIIPAGSGNGLAFAAGIRKNADQALQIIFHGKSKATDAFLINNRYACMLCGLGFDAAVAHNFSKQTNRGLKTYVQQSVKYFLAAPSYNFEIVIKDYSFKTDAYFINIANSNQFGNNVTIAPKAKLNDGLLDIVIVQKMNKAKLPFTVLQQVLGNNKLQFFNEQALKKNVLYFQTEALTIKNISFAPLHIDGEPGETSNEFYIQVLKNSFKLLQP